jgi:phage baseplate assembly protein V
MATNDNNPYEINNIHRQVSVNIMLGIVDEVDVKTGKVAVVINKKKFYGLKVIAQRAGANGKFWWLPAKGEQVIILSPFGNTTEGLILGSLPYGESGSNDEFNTHLPEDLTETTSSTIRKIYYGDGSTSSYDADKHEFLLTIKTNQDSAAETPFQVRLHANPEQESGIEITNGKARFSIQIQNDETIFIKTEKKLTLMAENIELIAKNVNVKKK